jgi:biuret amidohydrolase
LITVNCASIPRELFESKFFGHVKASLCVESHLRYLLEQGFEIAVVRDATAAFQLPGLDGYAAALTNFQVIANAVTTTEEVKGALNAQKQTN